MVFLAGEAGVGKTALVDAFCRGIADAAAVLRTSCDALSTPGPLGPCATWARPWALRPTACRSTATAATSCSGRCWTR